MRRLCVIACVLMILAVPGDRSRGGAAAEGSGPALAVRIVPTSFREESRRSIELYRPESHFHVVVTNISTRPVRLWKEWCSWGYFNLSFVVIGRDGRTLTVKKKNRGWDKNYPDSTIVPPGEHVVYEVAFDDERWIDPPLPPATGLREPRWVKMKAVYEVGADEQARKHGVWTGRITSPEETYLIYR